MKTAKKMGIRTVAVYSDADENSMHVDMVSLKLNLKKKVLLQGCYLRNYPFSIFSGR